MPNRRKKLTILFSLLSRIELAGVVVRGINWGTFVSWMKPSREKLWCRTSKFCCSSESLSRLFKAKGDFSRVGPVRLGWLCDVAGFFVRQLSFWFKPIAYSSLFWASSKNSNGFGGGFKLKSGGGRINFTRFVFLLKFVTWRFWHKKSWQISFLVCFLRLLRWRWGRRVLRLKLW